MVGRILEMTRMGAREVLREYPKQELANYVVTVYLGRHKSMRKNITAFYKGSNEVYASKEGMLEDITTRIEEDARLEMKATTPSKRTIKEALERGLDKMYRGKYD